MFVLTGMDLSVFMPTFFDIPELPVTLKIIKEHPIKEITFLDWSNYLKDSKSAVTSWKHIIRVVL